MEKRATLAGKATRKIGYENVKACQLEARGSKRAEIPHASVEIS